MANPPNSPLNIEGKDMSYFTYLCRLSVPYLKEQGVALNFKGYRETIEDYQNMKIHELDTAWRLAKELNAWSEYFSGIANLVRKVYLDADSEKTESHSLFSVSSDSISVSNGDRLANIQQEVIALKRKRNILKSLNDELDAKVKFLERAHYHCKSAYELGTENYNIIMRKPDDRGEINESESITNK